MNLAVKIAEKEGNIEDIELVQLAALLHDIGDYKYSGRFSVEFLKSLIWTCIET
jgi:HD superfamily phosphodiesterase